MRCYDSGDTPQWPRDQQDLIKCRYRVDILMAVHYDKISEIWFNVIMFTGWRFWWLSMTKRSMRFAQWMPVTSLPGVWMHVYVRETSTQTVLENCRASWTEYERDRKMFWGKQCRCTCVNVITTITSTTLDSGCMWMRHAVVSENILS